MYPCPRAHTHTQILARETTRARTHTQKIWTGLFMIKRRIQRYHETTKVETGILIPPGNAHKNKRKNSRHEKIPWDLFYIPAFVLTSNVRVKFAIYTFILKWKQVAEFCAYSVCYFLEKILILLHIIVSNILLKLRYFRSSQHKGLIPVRGMLMPNVRNVVSINY